MASFFDRLKERKLFQWALAYAAGAWAVLEASDLIGGQFDWPQRLLQSITVLVIVGFVVTLVLAWYHGEKGRQRVGGTEILVIAGILGVAGLVLTRLPGSGAGPGPVGEDTGLAPVQPLGPTSVALLPLGTSAVRETDGFFSEALHSEILTQLTKIGGLEVVGRATVARYVATERSVREIARELGVASIAEGVLFRDADRVRVDIQLTDPSTGRQRWAETYERDLTAASLFEIQAEIATEIAGALGVALSSAEQDELAARPTDDLDAYEAYLRGKSLFDADRWRDAAAAFEDAVALDSLFSTAWAGLASVSAVVYYTQGDRRPEELAQAKEALARAVRLAPEAVETRVAQAIHHTYIDLNYNAAEAQLSLALAQRPGDAWVLGWLGAALRHAGRWDEAIATLERALALDPMSGEGAHSLGYALRPLRRWEEASRYFDRAAELTPHDPILLNDRVRLALRGFGDTARARAILDEAPATASLESRSRALRRQLAWVRRDAEALARLSADSLWTNLRGAERYVGMLRLHLLRGDSLRQAAYADSLTMARRAGLDRVLRTDPERLRDLFVGLARAQLGVALALSGDEDGAVWEGELALEPEPRSVTAQNGPMLYYHLIRIYTFLGHDDTAIDWIEHELARPSVSITIERLRLEPDFDGLRDNPRFQALLDNPPSVN